jgi:uncharacterized protein involved in exopolysaccharide biosynthesis
VTVDLLDPPIPPERKSRPHRMLLVIGGFMASLGIGVGYALFQQDVSGTREATARFGAGASGAGLVR